MRPLLLLVALAGCKKQEPKDPATSPTVLFEAGEFWSSPLPSDHRLTATGVDLGDFPNPGGTGMVSQVIGLLAGESGWGTTSGVVLPTERAIDPSSLPDLWESVRPSASVYLVDLDSGERIPARVTARDFAGPHDPDHAIVAVPLQGVPLAPNTPHAVVVTDRVRTTDGDNLVPSAAIRSLQGRKIDEAFGAAEGLYTRAIDSLDALPAGLAAFTTGDPVSPMIALADDLRVRGMALIDAPALTEVYDDFCVYEGRLEVTSYQTGTAPFTTGGGGIHWIDGVPQPSHQEQGRFWLTTPRSGSDGSWPVAVMVRTGGGGDRPMIDRGRRDASGAAIEPAEGPARYFARAGWVGFQYDGPLGGLRNPTGGDEQFLVFNVTNPEALRDNLRQSAAELAAIPAFLDNVDLDAGDCPDHTPAPLKTTQMALLGHSMGATIAPLILPAAPEYQHVILSGAGGSWIENIVHKQSPLEVRPLAEAMLGYTSGQLTPDDPFLSLLQWAGETADPPVHGALARTADRNFLVFQGIVDTYILPPIANTTNLAFHLDQAGQALDGADPRLDPYDTLGALQPLVGTANLPLPVQGNQGATAVVIQHLEDGLEDGHEVMYQLDEAKAQLECFLRTARDGSPLVSNLCP